MKQTLFLLSLLLITFLTHAQNTFEHVFLSGPNVVDMEACDKSIELSNGDYIAMGYNPGCEFCQKPYYIRRYDYQGNLLFEKVYNYGSGGDFPDLIQTKDGNLLFYYAVGFPTVNLTWDFRLYFSKIDLNGNTLFTKDYYFQRPDQNGISLIQLDELSDSSIIFSCDKMVMKLNQRLDSLKSISIGEEIYLVNKLKSDSEIVIQHHIMSGNVDSVIQVVYSKNLDSLRLLFPNSSSFYNNFTNDWWIVGSEQYNDSSYINMVFKSMPITDSIAFVRSDENLNPLWIQYFAFPHRAFAIRYWDMNSNTITYWGDKWNSDFSIDSAFFYRLNIHTGDSLQFKVFAAENIYPQTGLRDLKYCTEGYLISGFVTGQQSYFAVLDTNGNVSTSVPTVSAPTMNVFNNPTSNQFSVELVGEKIYTFTLTDALGKIIEVKKGNGKMNFNIQNYAAGSYFLNVTGDQVKREVVIIKQ